MYSVQMVLEQARLRVRMAQESTQEQSRLILAAYAQLIDAQSSIEELQLRMREALRPANTTAA